MVARSAALRSCRVRLHGRAERRPGLPPPDLGPRKPIADGGLRRAVAATVGEDVLVEREDRRVTTLEEILRCRGLARPRAERHRSSPAVSRTRTTSRSRRRTVTSSGSPELEGALAVDRANERHNAAAASDDGGLAPDVEVLEDLDVMVIAFIDGTTMSAEALRDARAWPLGSRRRSAGCTPDHASCRTSTCSGSPTSTSACARRRESRIPDGFRGHLGRCCEDRTHPRPAAASDGAVPQRSPRRELHRRR